VYNIADASMRFLIMSKAWQFCSFCLEIFEMKIQNSIVLFIFIFQM